MLTSLAEIWNFFMRGFEAWIGASMNSAKGSLSLNCPEELLDCSSFDEALIRPIGLLGLLSSKAFCFKDSSF